MSTTRQNSLISFAFLGIASSGLIALVSLVSWLLDWEFLASLRSYHLFSSPDTASALLLLSVCQGILLFPGNRSWFTTAFVRISSLLVSVFGLVMVGNYFLHLNNGNVEHLFLFRTAEELELMSPATGLCLFLAGLGAFSGSIVRHSPLSLLSLRSAAFFGASIWFIAAFFVLGFMFGIPHLFGESVRSLALGTSFSLMLISSSLVVVAGKSYWPLRLFSDDTLKSRLLQVFFPLTLAFLLFDSWFTTFVHENMGFNPGLVSTWLFIVFLIGCLLAVSNMSKRISNSIDEADRKRRVAEDALKESERKEHEARLRVEEHAGKLSLLHHLGLSMNCQMTRRDLFDLLLRGSAEMTHADYGVMVTTTKDAVVIESRYSHPGSRQILENVCAEVEDLNQNIRLLTEQDGSEFVRFPTTRVTERYFGKSGEDEKLLVAVIRNASGAREGYLMLGIARGAVFQDEEDQEIVDLLLAQGSIALSNIINYERERKIAESMQTALLPVIPDSIDLGVGLVYLPADDSSRLGGDFCDVVDLGDGRLLVAIGDVCGKGFDAADLISMLKYMLRAFINEDVPLAETMEKLNAALYRQIPLEKFITLSLALIDSSENRITLASAGHPPALLVDSRHRATAIEGPFGIPFGIRESYQFQTVTIGDLGEYALVMYTDGLIEARPVLGEQFGRQRLSNLIERIDFGRPQNAVEEILSSAYVHSDGGIDDDVSIVVVSNEDKATRGHSGSMKKKSLKK